MDALLGWLAAESEADAAAFLQLLPSGEERLKVEPRGLDAEVLAGLIQWARRALVSTGDEPQILTGVRYTRWLGAGGPKVLVLLGASADRPEEPLRFARYVIEWLQRGGSSMERMDEVAGAVPGVARAGTAEDPAPILPTEGTGVDEVLTEVGRAIDRPETEVEIVDSSPGREELRVSLVDVNVSEDDRASAEVWLSWREQQLRGRGHGDPSEWGRYYAVARAAADALKPLVEGGIEVEGIYSARTRDKRRMLLASVRVDGERFVGAVLDRDEGGDQVGARAVLDAVNRRLPRIAGRSGRV